jgi:membrane fusion protein (multidrug efflux system)
VLVVRWGVVFVALSSALFIPACSKSQAEDRKGHAEEHQKLVVTSPVAKDVVSTQEYVAQIHSRRHIEVRALETGYLEEIHVQEGETVKKGDVMFKMVPVLYQAKLDTEAAHAKVQQIKFDNTKLLTNKSIVSNQELALAEAELAQAQAQVNLAKAELNFTTLKAPFAGIVDRQRAQQGSLVEEGDVLSTLSDNTTMWVYFNVPEARYLDYKAGVKTEMKIDLKLANSQIFPQPGKIGAIEAEFNNETGNIAFRADFENPDGLLRHGQTGTILVHRTLHDAIVIPQRATYEILAKKYVYVVEPEPESLHESPKVGEHGGHEPPEQAAGHGATVTAQRGVVRQREVVIQDEKDDVYMIKDGIGVNDRIIFEGIRQVRDGDHVEYEFESPEKILGNLKFHAE